MIERLILHIKNHPDANIEDIFKFLHQSTFGCEHLVSSFDVALSKIEAEKNADSPNGEPLVEALDGEYSRVDLKYLELGLKSDTLAKLFLISSRDPKESVEHLEKKLHAVRNKIEEGILAFPLDEFDEKWRKWRETEYTSLHHSDSFREKYKPTYRVISNRFVPFLPLFAKLDDELTKRRVILAIEGGSASGKSTLGEILRSVYRCAVFHMDDYFLPPEKRTKERLDEIGGNVDRERFDAEILTPLKNGEKVIKYRRFDCSTMSLCEPTTVITTPLIVVEGAYSMHPTLSEKYDLSVFLDITPEKQRSRIEKRNSPQFARRFFEEWIPLENKYFDSFNIKNKCDIVIEI